jgi:hypothetical protein
MSEVDLVGGDAPVGETERERLNRNFNELLQELRVIQTGVQILFGFMLTLPFAAGFDRLSPTQRAVVCAVAVAATTALGDVATGLVTGVVAAAMVLCWVVIPLVLRVRSPRIRVR